MISKIVRSFICCTLIVATFFLSSCGEDAKKDHHLKIVASFYPIYISALNVTDGVNNVEVINLTDKKVGCLHDYQLNNENMRLLSSADVFIINGGGMEEFMDKARHDNPKLEIIDASKNTNIRWIKEGKGVNPHVWMNIRYNIEQVNRIADELSRIDAAHATNYQTNARLYTERLMRLETEIHAVISDLKTKDLVTFHDAFPYLAEEYHLNIVASIEATPGQPPSPEEISQIIEKIRPLERKVIFTEPQYSPEAAEMLAYKTGAQIYTLDPIVTGEPNKDAYIEAMRMNAGVLRRALQ